MRTTLLVSALVAWAIVPSTTAYHLSIGASDSVGVSPAEAATAPSVPSSSDLFRIGTGQVPCQRFEPTGDGLQPGAITADAAALVVTHPFCRRLIHNHGTPQQVVSPPDQDYPLNGAGEVWRFDVVFASYVGNYGLNASPFGGGTRAIVNNLGRALGLWPDGDSPDGNSKICEDEKAANSGTSSCGTQEYAVNLAVANPAFAAQELLRANAGVTVAQGNGWFMPVYDQTILGFLFLNGQPADAATLKSRVQAHVAAGRLPGTAVAGICGFEPEPGVNTQSGVSDLRGWCEVAFDWVGSESPNPLDDPATWNYGDPCTSRTYFCGVAGGGAWFGTEVCSFHPRTGAGYNDCNADDHGKTQNGFESTTDYDVWHFVVAPTISPCNGRAPPGFRTTAVGSIKPYLAHDLDVFAPVGTSHAKTGLDDVDRFEDYYADGDDDWTDGGFDDSQTDRTLDDIGEPLIRKNNHIEPNAAGDTSGTVTAPRVPHECAPIVNGGLHRPGRAPMVETAVDPWVNYIDSRMVDVGTGPRDLYLNTDPNQDASNRPANDIVSFAGRVGFFADADDDFVRADAEDEYEAISPNLGSPTSDPQDIVSHLDPFWIESIGAYPMFWDAWLDLSGRNPSNRFACKPAWTPITGQSLPDAMAVAGYDITRTGLVQVAYTSLPAVAYTSPIHGGTTDVLLPQLIGAGTALVFLSQGLHELRSDGSTADRAFVQGLIDDALALLPIAPGAVVAPRDAITSWPLYRLEGNQSDFGSQCNASTGSFSNGWSLSRVCDGKQQACAGDTVVTAYTFRLHATLGSAQIPAPPVPLATGVQHTWWDVDPLDNDPSRNT